MNYNSGIYTNTIIKAASKEFREAAFYNDIVYFIF